MFGMQRKGQEFQLYLYVILITQARFLRGSDDSNSNDIQSLLDEFATSENETGHFPSDFNNVFETSRNNDTNNELVIKKNLYIFPVNAPNLVIAQKHEIHAIPVENATNSMDGEPVTELHDIHEISLSKLLPVNASEMGDIENGTISENNFNLSAPGNLEIVSGYKAGSGLITKEIPLPQTVSKSVILPQNSIVDLLSSLNETAKESEGQTTEIPDIAKRAAEDQSKLAPTDYLTMTNQEIRSPSNNKSKLIGSELKSLTPNEEIEDSEDMDVAEDIVFRPLFRYRQETRLRPQYLDDGIYRSYDNRRRNRYKYNNYNNYDNYYYSRYRYRPRSRSGDDDSNDYN